MSKITLGRLTSLTNEESVIAALNEWAETLEEFSDLVLSRNGQSPNTMTANLDMNSQRILNLAAPVDDNDPVRLIDVVDGIQGEQGEPGEPGGPLADGDYGDILVSSTGTVMTIDGAVLSTVGRTLVSQASQSDMRTTGLGLGNAATFDIGFDDGTIAQGSDSRFTRYNINLQNSAYTIPINNAPTIHYHYDAGTVTYTIDPISSTDYPEGYTTYVHNGAISGDITIARGSGVTLYVNGATTSSNATVDAGGMCTLIHLGVDTWLCIGPKVA